MTAGNMANGTWHIEQGCPQCGAPVTLDETDRLLACPFCRTRLYLVRGGTIPLLHPARHCGRRGTPLHPLLASPGFLLFRHRLRGGPPLRRHEHPGRRPPGASRLPRPPAAGPEAPLSSRRPRRDGSSPRTLSADQAIPGLGAAPHGAFYREFIGETVSLIHAPLLLRGETLTDAILGKPVAVLHNRRTGTSAERPPAPCVPRSVFVPTLCPRCGWDMEGERDSLVLICRNCDSRMGVSRRTPSPRWNLP